MNKEYFNSLVSNPEESTVYDAVGLTELIRNYPFFQSAHLILLYNLKKSGSEEYDSQLRESSIVISDRSILFNRLTNIQPVASFAAPKITETEQPAVNLVPTKTVDFQLEKDSPVEENRESEKTVYIPGETLKTGLLEIEDNAALDSPEVTNISKTEGDSPDLIKKFLDDIPSFSPARIEFKEQQPDISSESIKESDEIITITLATIYESQKLYELMKN
jgi:hypothetical protein